MIFLLKCLNASQKTCLNFDMCQFARLLCFLTCLFCVPMVLAAQESIYEDNYLGKPLKGVYTPLSYDDSYTVTKVIAPQNMVPERFHSLLLVKKKPIILFKTSRPEGKDDVAGILKENSLAELIEQRYRNHYLDPEREFFFTHEVWKKIKINGQIYFTDIKLHEAESQLLELPQFEQRFLLLADHTGYDGNYDIGYPEYFRALFFDKQGQLIHLSEELPVHCNCEFGPFSDMPEDNILIEPKSFQFKIPGLEYDPVTETSKSYTYTGLWNGKELKGSVEIHQ